MEIEFERKEIEFEDCHDFWNVYPKSKLISENSDLVQFKKALFKELDYKLNNSARDKLKVLKSEILDMEVLIQFCSELEKIGLSSSIYLIAKEVAEMGIRITNEEYFYGKNLFERILNSKYFQNIKASTATSFDSQYISYKGYHSPEEYFEKLRIPQEMNNEYAFFVQGYCHTFYYHHLKSQLSKLEFYPERQSSSNSVKSLGPIQKPYKLLYLLMDKFEMFNGENFKSLTAVKRAKLLSIIFTLESEGIRQDLSKVNDFIKEGNNKIELEKLIHEVNTAKQNKKKKS